MQAVVQKIPCLLRRRPAQAVPLGRETDEGVPHRVPLQDDRVDAELRHDAAPNARPGAAGEGRAGGAEDPGGVREERQRRPWLRLEGLAIDRSTFAVFRPAVSPSCFTFNKRWVFC